MVGLNPCVTRSGPWFWIDSARMETLGNSDSGPGPLRCRFGNRITLSNSGNFN